jgi:hypothetical protein
MDSMGNATDTMTADMMSQEMWWHNDTGLMFGAISSIQNDENGEPAWLVTGHWMMTNTTGSSNTTGTNITDLYAGFHMIMLDGSAGHTHEVYNFTQSGESTTAGNVTTVSGTSTVTMRNGPVNDVGTEIEISQGKVLAITFDPAPINSHFGDTPVYGLVITPEIMGHMMNTTTASTMGDSMDYERWDGNTTTSATEKWE